MRRFTILFAAALLALAALAPNAVHAQVIGVQFARPYTPVYVQPTVVPAYYAAPGYVVPSGVPMIAPSYASTIHVVPQSTAVYSYYAPPTYSYAAPTYSYAAPVYSAPSYSYTTRTYQGFGVFRPRGTYTQVYTYP